MTLRDFLSIFTSGAIALRALSVVWLAMLAAPIWLLWNFAVVPLGPLPVVGYIQVLGILVIWFLLRLAYGAMRWSDPDRDPLSGFGNDQPRRDSP